MSTATLLEVGELANLGGFIHESVLVIGYMCEMNVCA